MNIAKDCVVSFHYTLKNAAGAEIESSRGGEPVAQLQGHGNIIAGLEEAMLGKGPGDTFSVTVPPEKGYGARRENWVQRISVKHLQGARHWRPGMTAVVETGQGPRQVTVKKVGRFMADVDLNHPMAGETLIFDIEIVSVREPAKEELAHGHVHGAGGHHR